jgi:23S rRNA G2445 N2-methylase RlmL
MALPSSPFHSDTTILVTCQKGIAPFLADELRSLGYENLIQHIAGVELRGTWSNALHLNMQSRLGLRVLYLLGEFQADTADDVYRGTHDIVWEDILDVTGYVSVVSSVKTESITNTQFANVKCKDAIVDRIRSKRGARPDSGSDTSKAVIFLYWHGTRVMVYYDTSGAPLAQRGYRLQQHSAPLKENLACAIIRATRWDYTSPLVNPMCGSGTLAIEAALMANNIAPGLLRDNFSFMHTLLFQAKEWHIMREEARNAVRTSVTEYHVSDHDPQAVEAARSNARRAGVHTTMTFETTPFERCTVPPASASTSPIVILNPEYGIRMGTDEDLSEVYATIGDFFKQRCAGYWGYVFTGNIELGKRVGLKPKRRIPFFTADIECRLFEYELYAGTRRIIPHEEQKPLENDTAPLSQQE